MAEKKKTEEPISEQKSVDIEAFKARKLKAINEMEDQAKARFLANRIINN